MANPSLQIGNSNWAIKEDDLLGYSTVGTNYLPKPMTMTRASAGTRVNSQGLVETVELLGSELVDDGSFPLPNTEWDLTGGAEVTALGGRIYSSSGGVSSLDQSIGMVVGNNYKITLDVIATNGTKLSNPNGTNVYDTSTIGSKVFYITAAYSTLYFKRQTGITDVTINNVSVKESTKNNLARVDYDGTASSLLVEPQRRNLVTYSEAISNLTLLTNGTGTFTITDNYTDSPQGVQNASRVQMSIVDTNDGANYRLINTGSSMTNGVTREISFYAKSLTGLNQEVLVYWSYAKQIVTLTNDWQRFEISGTSDNSGAVLIGTRGGTTQYYAGGDANLDFAIWGLQVEDDGSGGGSSYATSYIPTSGSTVTRVQDQYSKTGISNLINSEEGSFFVDIAALNTYPGSQISISLSGNGSNDRVLIYTGSGGGEWLAQFRKDGVNIVSVSKNTTITNQSKLAVSWKSGKYLMYIDGDKATTYNTGSETESDTFDAGDLKNLQLSPFYNSSGNLFFGKVKQLQVFKTALTDTELKTLTTI